MSPPQEFETNSLPLLPLSSKQVDNVSLNSYCILNRAVNHCAWHRSFLDLRFFFFLNPFFISKNLLISLLCWPTYTKFTRIICIYQARKKVHGRSQSRTAVVFGCGQMSIYERPPAAGLQNFFQAWYFHILCCILTLIEKEHKSIWINGVNLILKIFFTLHLFSFFTIFHFPYLFFL